MARLKTIVGLLGRRGGCRGRRARGGASVCVQRADRDPVREDLRRNRRSRVGSAGNGGTFEMQVTSFRASGKAGQLMVTEWVTVGNISFRAEMNGHASPAGFIVRNGTVTGGSFAGAQVHQRSNLVGVEETTTAWSGALQLVPSSA